MGDFNKAMDVIRKHEGGYVDHPNDPGGATNYGISLRLLKSLGDYGDFDRDGDVDKDDIKALSQDKADDIYHKEFWDKYKYDCIHDDRVATKVFDISVNCGPGTAARVIQKAVNALRGNDALKIDGNLGEKSFLAINKLHPDDLLSQVVWFQKAYYRALCDEKPALEVFLRGWLTRAEHT